MSEVSTIVMPFVTEDSQVYTLYLPTDMSIKDARRLKRMINALYINHREQEVNGDE